MRTLDQGLFTMRSQHNENLLSNDSVILNVNNIFSIFQFLSIIATLHLKLSNFKKFLKEKPLKTKD